MCSGRAQRKASRWASHHRRKVLGSDPVTSATVGRTVVSSAVPPTKNSKKASTYLRHLRLHLRPGLFVGLGTKADLPTEDLGEDLHLLYGTNASGPLR